MSTVDRYIEEVLRRVFADSRDRQRLAADLRAHIAEAEGDGRPVRQILDDLGAPSEVAAAFNADRTIEQAGFWRRLVAFIGDVGVLILLMIPAVTPLVIVSALNPEGSSPSGPVVGGIVLGALLAFTGFGIIVFYFPLLEARFGQTLGKKLVGIRVIREDGSPIGLGQAFVRRLSLYFEMLLVDALFIPFTEKRQRALDIVAKTLVAREPGRRESAAGYLLCLLLPVIAGAVAALLVTLLGPLTARM